MILTWGGRVVWGAGSSVSESIMTSGPDEQALTQLALLLMTSPLGFRRTFQGRKIFTCINIFRHKLKFSVPSKVPVLIHHASRTGILLHPLQLHAFPMDSLWQVYLLEVQKKESEIPRRYTAANPKIFLCMVQVQEQVCHRQVAVPYHVVLMGK